MGALGASGQTTFKRGDFSMVAAAQFHQKPDWTTTYRYRNPSAGGLPIQDITIPDRAPGAYLGANYKGLSFMSSFSDWDTAYFVRGTVGENRWRRGFADLGYALKARDKWDMNFNLTYTRTTLESTRFPFIDRDSNDVVVEWTNFFSPTDKDRLTFGTLYNHIQGREIYFGVSPSVQISGDGRSGGALYAQLDHRLRDNLKLIGGFQANKIENIDLNVVPRAGIIWNPASRVNVRALYSKAFRAPSINETRLQHPNGLRGNLNLRPEKVGTVDVGVGYQGNSLQVGVNYFRSEQTDSIVVDSSTGVRLYANLGQATFHGVELEGKYYFKKNLLLLGSLLYQANEDAKGNKNVTPIANTGVKAGISYQAENGLTAGLFDVYQGPLGGYTGVNPKTEPYHLLNSHLRFDLSRHLGAGAKTGLALFVHADNLANRQVWLPEWGGNAGDTIPVHRGRTVYFGIEVSLKKD